MVELGTSVTPGAAVPPPSAADDCCPSATTCCAAEGSGSGAGTGCGYATGRSNRGTASQGRPGGRERSLPCARSSSCVEACCLRSSKRHGRVPRGPDRHPPGGPGSVSQHFKSYDFLRDHEVGVHLP